MLASGAIRDACWKNTSSSGSMASAITTCIHSARRTKPDCPQRPQPVQAITITAQNDSHQPYESTDSGSTSSVTAMASAMARGNCTLRLTSTASMNTATMTSARRAGIPSPDSKA